MKKRPGLKREPLIGALISKRKQGFTLAKLKKEHTYAEVTEILDRTKSIIDSKKLFKRSPCRTWNETALPTHFPQSRNWVQEFGWLAHTFIANSELLNNFLELRAQFGKHYLLGDYSSASKVLDEIEANLGLSLWLAERRFMLLQKEKGFNSHKEYLSQIQDNLENNYVAYLVTTLSNRVEEYVVPASYIKKVSTLLSGLRSSGHRDFAALTEILISPWTFDWIDDKHHILHELGELALPDAYTRSLKVIALAVAGKLSEAEEKQLRRILHDLQSVVFDCQFENQLAFLNCSSNRISNSSSSYLVGLDHFASGEFQKAAEACLNHIIQEPTCFAFYRLCANAIACSGVDLELPLPPKCLAREILSNLISIESNKASVEIPLLQLKSFAFTLGDNHLGLSLWQYAEFELEGTECLEAKALARVQSKIVFAHPDLISSLNSAEEFEFPEEFKSLCSSHPGLRLQTFCASSEERSAKDLSGLHPPFVAFVSAIRESKARNYAGALNCLTPILAMANQRDASALFLLGKVAPIEFEALMELGRPEDAARSILNHYIHSPNILRHVQFERIVNEGLSGRLGHLKDLPSWPILVFLNSEDEQEVYEAVDDFLVSQNLSNPIELCDEAFKCSLSEQRILLRDVLVPQVLAWGALWARTQEDRRQLRTQLLQRLFSISVEDQGMVLMELAKIEQERSLESAYRHVEGPKFNKNFFEIAEPLEKLFYGIFERYKEHRHYEDDGGLLATEDQLFLKAMPNLDASGGALVNETSAIILQHIFSVIFTNYIADANIGIDATLGTRIRHGSIENQLTRVFGANHLLSSVGPDDNHVCDAYITELIRPLDPTESATIVESVGRFTEGFRSLLKRLIDTEMRVRVPEGVIRMMVLDGVKANELRTDCGLLDFSELFSIELFDELKDVRYDSISEIIKEAEIRFVRVAQKIFGRVRSFIEGDLHQQIIGLIDILDQEILSCTPIGPIRASFLANILSAREQIVGDLGIISNWFDYAEQSSSGPRSMRQAFEMAHRVVGFASNERLGELQFRGFDDSQFDPRNGESLYEIAAIILRNIVQHSEVDRGQVVICSQIVQRDRIVLSIENRMANRAVCEKCIENAKRSIDLPFDDWALSKSPGGTGYRRIRKLFNRIGCKELSLEVVRRKGPERFNLIIVYQL